MKKLRYALMICSAVAFLTMHAQQEQFRVILEAKWEDLEQNSERTKLFGGKWILAGSITFKKRSSETVFLDEIQLTWNGKKLDNLIASLYEKNNTSSFLPIEKYCVCDSRWKCSTQQLFLRFNKPFVLGAVTTFYLVLTVPEPLEPVLKKGTFRIEYAGLPLPYRDYVKGKELSLALNNIGTPASTT